MINNLNILIFENIHINRAFTNKVTKKQFTTNESPLYDLYKKYSDMQEQHLK
jgi:hypothetical protein